jgi:hypothetical protein
LKSKTLHPFRAGWLFCTNRISYWSSSPRQGFQSLACAVSFTLPDQIAIDKAHYCSVAHTIADGNGVFDLSEVLTGDYTLIIQSSHTKGAPGSGTAAGTMRDVGGRVVTFPIALGLGQTLDKSWDFGISSF